MEKEIHLVDYSLQYTLALLLKKDLITHETYIFYSRMLSTVSDSYLAYLDCIKE